MKKKITYLSILISLFVFWAQDPAWAQKEWIQHTSKSKLFSVRMPETFSETSTHFDLTSRITAQSGQLVSTFDYRPLNKPVVKNYIVKYEQTFGRELTDNDISNLLSQELERYALYYETLNGVQKRRSGVIYQDDVPGSELHVAYDDPELGPQHILIRIFFTRTSKITQIISGPENVIYAYLSDKFAESLSMKEGYAQNAENPNLVSQWSEYPSPLGVFNAYLPAPLAPYVPTTAKFDNSDTVERMSAQFYDPVWKSTLSFNVYGYKTSTELSPAQVKALMRTKHTSRLRPSGETLKIQELFNNGRPVFESEFHITPPKGQAYANWAKVRVRFVGNYVLVYELIGVPNHVNSPFTDYLIASVDFLPAKQKPANN